MPENTIEFEINAGWNDFVNNEFSKAYYANLLAFLNLEYQRNNIYPDKKNVFKALNSTSLNDVKVIILGQDPYHSFELNEGVEIPHAHGLSFSITKACKKIPPSLRNIFKELKTDLGCVIPQHGNLESWTKQGVLLVNSSLTVKKHEASSHQKIGWEIFTDNLIQHISANKKDVIFLLWGNFAIGKEHLIDVTKHVILKSPHPSPFSAYRGFFGCKHFSKVNEVLKRNNQKEIDWEIK